MSSATINDRAVNFFEDNFFVSSANISARNNFGTGWVRLWNYSWMEGLSYDK